MSECRPGDGLAVAVVANAKRSRQSGLVLNMAVKRKKGAS